MISAAFPYQKQRRRILGQEMAYVEVGKGDPIVLLHGNPTSSYLWRNVIPHLESLGRCIAPDLIGMGDSEELPDSGPATYRFVERGRYLAPLAAAMAGYRRPYAGPGEGRRPTLTFPREIPIEGDPADVTAAVDAYADWLKNSSVPKLFLKAEPGGILAEGKVLEFARSLPAQTEVTVKGVHFVQEDSPDEIGSAIAAWMKTLG